MEKYFNFNNEQAITPIDVDTVTGEVTFELDGESTTFESVQEFAEFYADARNVKPENLKNWALVEDGDTYSFILRAGSAGVDERDMANVARTLRESGMSPVEVARAMADLQAEAREQQEVRQQESIRERVIEDAMENLAGTNDEKLLMLAYDVRDSAALNEAVEDDASLFEDHLEADYDEYDEYDEYVEYDDYDEYDVFRDNIYSKINEQKEALKEEYLGAPLAIVLAILFAEEIDESYREGAVDKFVKAKRAASAAGRKVPVTIMNVEDAETIVITRTFHNKEEVDLDEGVLYVYDRRFILVKGILVKAEELDAFIIEVLDENDVEDVEDNEEDVF